MSKSPAVATSDEPHPSRSIVDLDPTISCILPRFRAQVAANPQQAAVAFEGSTLTYEQLDASSNRVANCLLEQRVRREDCVGVCLDRSDTAIITMLGILKSGAAFVPLDPEFPTDRLQYMVGDAQIKRVICDVRYRDLFANAPDDVKILAPPRLCEFQNSQAPDVRVDPSQLAYVMYTSGSTGQPKGVQIEHGSLDCYCLADADVYRLVPADRTLQFSTLNFDIAIEEIFPPLITGGTVVVRPRERAEGQNELSEIVERDHVTAIHLATAYWHEWVDLMKASEVRVPASIRLMIVTGEKVSAQHYQRWLELCDHDVLWCNAYGPTEATVTSTVFIPPRGWSGENLPIGQPLPGYTAWVLDESGQPVAIPTEATTSQTGELYIGGPALARGYLNLPKQTNRAFVNREIRGETLRLYKTGDLARWSHSGDLEFGGRIDHQIKLGSFRIEPAEIEAAINQHPHVLESLVSYDEVDGKKTLIGFVARGSADISANDVVNHLRDRLPVYMIPTRYVFLDAFPKTINGKIDRAALPGPSESEVARDGEFAEPTNALERQLVDLWSEVLNVPEVGIHDDFFQLGGSSLLVTRVIGRIKTQLDLEIPVRDFFANPTVACIARHLKYLDNPAQSCDDHDATSEMLRRSLPEIEACYLEGSCERLYAVAYAPRSERRRIQANQPSIRGADLPRLRARVSAIVSQPATVGVGTVARRCPRVAIRLLGYRQFDWNRP